MPGGVRAAPATTPARPDHPSQAYRWAGSPGEGGCGCRDRAGPAPLRGLASETGAVETARPAPRARTGPTQRRAQQTATPAIVRPRTPPETVQRQSIAAPDAASFAPTQSHISPAARPATAAVAKWRQGRAMAL